MGEIIVIMLGLMDAGLILAWVRYEPLFAGDGGTKV